MISGGSPLGWSAAVACCAINILASCGGSTASSSSDASIDATPQEAATDSESSETSNPHDGGIVDGTSFDADGTFSDVITEETSLGDAGEDVVNSDGGCGPISTGNGVKCDQCAGSHCCAQYSVCVSSSDCLSYADCLNACAVEAGAGTPDGGPCFDNCGAKYPIGENELNSYEGCLFGPFCYFACTN
jgi:hypothetical protein